MKYDKKKDQIRYDVKPTDSIYPYCVDVRYSNAQLEVISDGIEVGVDVTVYANPDIPASTMRQILGSLMKCTHEFTLSYLDGDERKSHRIFARTKKGALDTFKFASPDKPVIEVAFTSDIQ